jgi:YesN/AraC family two-component response regulator
MTIKNDISSRVLLIDDELVNLRLLIEFLKHQGFSLIVAQGGSEGLQLALKTQPELILLDVRMPDLDGFSVYQRLLAHPKTANSLVIFLSAIDDINYKEYALNLGAVDYLIKPINSRELLARIHAHLARHRRHQDALTRLDNYEKQVGLNTATNKFDDKKIQMITQYLLTNLQHTPTLNELAQIANTNRTSINILFRNHFGMSIFAWLTEQRLLRAAVLLRTSALPIQAIIEAVGYATTSALTHAFKRRFGYTPNEYRLSDSK